MTASKANEKDSRILLITTAALIVLLVISGVSIHLFIKSRNEASSREKKKVLGAEVINNEKSFWINFLDDNPYYHPGWKRLNEISHETNDEKLKIETENELVKLKPVEE